MGVKIVCMNKSLYMANEAFAYAALEAEVNVVAGYPGTPSSEVIETVAREVEAGRAQGVHVEWSTNEKAALEVLAGASYCGARTLFTCKQVGLNVASDPLMSLNYIGVDGGMVVLVADDPGPISSQTEQDTRRFGQFAKIPVLDPATPEQGCEMIKFAFGLSEEYRTPVIFRPTTRICHASTFFDTFEGSEAGGVDEFYKDPQYVIFPPLSHKMHGVILERLKKISKDFSESAFNPVTRGSSKVGIIAGGISYAYVREALRDNDEFSIMQIGTPYPFPEDAVLEFVQDLDKVIVFEELDNVIEEELLKLVGKRHLELEVEGHLHPGENSTELISQALVSESEGATRHSERSEEFPASIKVPARPPALCPGCPHRASFYAVKKAVGVRRKAIYCGDIGCYTLGNAKPLETTDTCLCMGAGITIAQGIQIVEPGTKCIAFVGDSTFFASGMTGVANAVYNNHDITICVLDNSTTAMTGGQPHPGIGRTLMGDSRKGISIEETLKSLGVKKIVKSNPMHLNDAIDEAKEAIDFEGPSAIIFKYPCANLIKKKEPVRFDFEKCVSCKRCTSSIGCPAIYWGGALRVAIDKNLCTGCGVCTHLCKHGALEVSHA